ncbi:hypothetical protein [Wenyingzhuangia sp. IMCC45574]
MKHRQLLLVFMVVLFSCSKNNSSNNIEDIPEQETPETVDKTEPTITFVDTDFYTAPTSFAVTKNLVMDYGVDNSFTTDDSQKLQKAINEINSLGGGKLLIPTGNYSFAEIVLKSNVHIVISKDAVIRPSLRGDTKNFKIFGIGRNNDKVENISIVSDSDTEKFTIDLKHGDNRNVGVFGFGYAENFLISGVNILDDLTIFSSFTFGISQYNGEWKFSENGIIRDAITSGAHYGYGLVQAQALRNTLFQNVDGEGGVTLRLETGEKAMNNLQIGGVFDIFGDDVGGIDGNAALMISPHAMHCGKVYVQNVNSRGCGLGVRIGGGYVSKKYDQTIGLTDGTYERVELRNVKVTFGNKAQLKSKHYKYMPCELRSEISTTPISEEGVSFYGPSVAGVLSTANFPVIFEDSKLTATGFKEGHEFMGEEDAIENCN